VSVRLSSYLRNSHCTDFIGLLYCITWGPNVVYVVFYGTGNQIIIYGQEFEACLYKSWKTPISFVMSVRPCIRRYQRGSQWTDRRERDFTKMRLWTPDLVKMRQKCRVLYVLTLCFILLAVKYVEQQYRERVTVLRWQSFRYLLHCWQYHMYVNNTKGTHFCVTQVRRSVNIICERTLPALFLFLSMFM